MKTILTLAELAELRAELGVRADWHEPDEQDVTATIIGTHLDNAICGPPSDYMLANSAGIEYAVQISKGGERVAHVNLALLMGLICKSYVGHRTDLPGGDFPAGELTPVTSAARLEALRRHLGARPDWHEPDEQDVTATIIGAHLDNADVGASSEGLSASGNTGYAIQVHQKGRPVAHINLALLLSWGAVIAEVESAATGPLTIEPGRAAKFVEYATAMLTARAAADVAWHGGQLLFSARLAEKLFAELAALTLVDGSDRHALVKMLLKSDDSTPQALLESVVALLRRSREVRYSPTPTLRDRLIAEARALRAKAPCDEYQYDQGLIDLTLRALDLDEEDADRQAEIGHAILSDQ